MASIDDILTALKNLVVAQNAQTQATNRQAGQYTTPGLTTTTLIAVGTGRVVQYSVVAGSSTAGKIYNASNVSSISTTNAMSYMNAAAGTYPVSLVFNTGLVVAPGSGQTVTVTYSLG